MKSHALHHMANIEEFNENNNLAWTVNLAACNRRSLWADILEAWQRLKLENWTKSSHSMRIRGRYSMLSSFLPVVSFLFVLVLSLRFKRYCDRTLCEVGVAQLAWGWSLCKVWGAVRNWYVGGVEFVISEPMSWGWIPYCCEVGPLHFAVLTELPQTFHLNILFFASQIFTCLRCICWYHIPRHLE